MIWMEILYPVTDFALGVFLLYQTSLHVLNYLRRRSHLEMTMDAAFLVFIGMKRLEGGHYSNKTAVHQVKTAL